MLYKAQKVALALAAPLYVSAGILHFLRPGSYIKIMPPYIPAPLEMVYPSGAAEIAGGAGLLIPWLRRTAAWGLVSLLIAVFPANLYMAQNDVQVTEHPIPPAILWARLPLQALLIWWILWCTGEGSEEGVARS